MFVGNIRRPDGEARVVAKRTEEAHNRVGEHDERRCEHERRFRDEFAKSEHDGKQAPEDIADAYKRLAAANAVAPGPNEERAERRDHGA
ncbi:hypothetical protein SDC9_144260 [bioreactor metagenome]|uniref:Uncharacterized protein n=1 Tax=bioreactor metagenome TaxID=1076179 RepID=A0A645E5Q6_9ZZZZ